LIPSGGITTISGIFLGSARGEFTWSKLIITIKTVKNKSVEHIYNKLLSITIAATTTTTTITITITITIAVVILYKNSSKQISTDQVKTLV